MKKHCRQPPRESLSDRETSPFQAMLGVENESVEQIAFADRIILNKTDLVDEEQLKEVEASVKKINSSAEIIRSQLLWLDETPLFFLITIFAFMNSTYFVGA